jgi:hypothetical protein
VYRKYEADPWAFLADRHPNVKVRFRSDLDDRWGQTVWYGDETIIYLAYDLGRPQRRCTLAHELMHIDLRLGSNPADELVVRHATARFMLPDVAAMGRALHDLDILDAADTLGVARGVLVDRIDCLTDDEVAELGAALRHNRKLARSGAGCTPGRTLPHRRQA